VLEEVKSKYREDLLQASRKFWDALKRLHYLEWSLQSERSKGPSEFEIPSPADNPLLDVERKVEGYFNYLESRLKLLSFVAPRLKRLDDLEKQLSEGTFASLSLQKLVEDRDEEVTSLINNELPDLLDEPRFDEPSVVGLYHPAQIDSVVVYENDKTTLFVQFGANIDVDVEFFIEKGDYYVLDEEQDDFSIYGPDWNEWVMRGGRNITTAIDCSLIFNLEKNKVANFKVLGVSRIWSDE
jgi:hypothetical protein